MVAQGYAQAYRATAVLTASPGQLVLMLFDGALKSLAIAQDAFSKPVTDRSRFETINKHL
jgi:flagellar protein FliS